MSGPVDYSELAEAVSFGSIATGVMGVAAALIGVYVLIRGFRFMVGFVRGGEEGPAQGDLFGGGGEVWSDAYFTYYDKHDGAEQVLAVRKDDDEVTFFDRDEYEARYKAQNG